MWDSKHQARSRLRSPQRPLSPRASRTTGGLALGLFVGVLSSACADKDPSPAPSDAAAETAGAEASAKALDLWDGVPPLEASADDIATELEPRPGPLKPKTVGETIEVPFPAESGPSIGPGPSTPTGPLTVERFGPEGAQNLVDAIRVSFSEAMVPLATVEALRAHDVPLEIDPKPPGEAKWLGTRTVAYQTQGRLPYSTTYEVTVPTTAKSIHGHSLEKPLRWSFSTPPLATASVSPQGEQVGLEPTIEIQFNQPIQRVAVLAALQVRGGGKRIETEPLPSTLAEDATDAQREIEARILRVRPKAPLRTNTSYTIKLPAGVFGEGPNKSKAIEHRFSTYPPFKLSVTPCARPCWASNGISLASTTSIRDPRVSERVTVTPAVENLRVSSGYRGVQLSGDFEGNATYTVEVAPELVDSFGQTLGKPFKKSIKLGPLAPALSLLQPGRDPAVIEKGATARLPLRVAGLDQVEVSGRALDTSDLDKFLGGYWDRQWAWPADRGVPSFHEFFDVKTSRARKQPLDIDLDPILGEGAAKKSFGWLLARSNEYEMWGSPQRQAVTQLFEVTDLGVAAVLDHDDGMVAVHRFTTNDAVADARVVLIDNYGKNVWEGTTNADGLAEPSWTGTGPRLIAVEADGDQAFMRVDQSGQQGGWRSSSPPTDRPRALFFTERTPYKPSETIHLVGILRQEIAKPDGGITSWRKETTANYTVTNPRGVEVAKGEVKIGKLGSFSVDIETKEEHGTGNFNFQLTLPSWFTSDTRFYHSIPVETFRTPEFEVDVERPTSVPLVFGDSLRAQVEARYLHGAPMIGADVAYTLTRTDSGFTPPGELNEGFSFGTHQRRGGHFGSYHWTPPPRQVASGAGKTTAAGVFEVSHALAAIDPPAQADAAPPKADAPPPGAATYTLAATVTDENRQAIAGSGAFVVHAAEVYVGLRSDRMVLKEGERTSVQAVAVDLSGERIADQNLAVDVVRRDTQRKAVEKDGRWTFEYETHEETVSSCKLVSRGVPVACDVDVGKAGTYVVRGRTTDARGRATQTEVQLFVHGKDAVVWDEGQQRVDLVPDRSKYEPGDTVNLLVRSPFDQAEGVLVVEREGIAKRMPLHVRGGTTAVELTIEDAWTPGVSVSAMLWRGRTAVEGAPPGQDLGMPAVASGRVELDVSTENHRIDVELTPSAKELEPKGKLTVDIATRDAEGNPISSAVALMVVDEGVLSLMNHATPDPLGFFIRKRAGQVWMNALHANVMPRQEGTPSPTDLPLPTTLEESESDPTYHDTGGLALLGAVADESAPPPAIPGAPMAKSGSNKDKSKQTPRKRAFVGGRGPMPSSAPAMDMDRASGHFLASTAMSQPVSLRTVFASTAYFDPDVQTDASGKATVTIDMPENLTTFRVMAVAVDADEVDRFGSADTTVRVRKAVMLRPSLPRFANYGDAFEASVMVDNQTGADQKVLVGTRGTNVEIASDDQKFVDIPSGESKEVRFSMKTQEVGTMRVQFAAMSNEGRDATQLEIPVHYPATAEAFADYGMTDTSMSRTLEPPKDVLSAFGGLELSFSSTALSGLEDAVQYLVEYRYECAEQTASRVLPIFVLGKVLDEFPIASVRDDVKRELIARRGVDKLFAKQNPDGGFGYWHSGESWPYVSTWATFALLEGKRAGFAVDEAKLDAAIRYVENFVRYGHRSRWGVYYDWTTRAFGLWLLSREGRGEGSFDAVWSQREKLPLYARAFLMSAAQTYGKTSQRDAVLEQIRDAVVESPKTIHFAESRTEAAAADGLRLLMHSNTQTDAIVLMALLEAVPTEPMLPKVMAGIMASRDPLQGGRWGSTHTNAWALLSASRYYEVVEADEPDFTARAWLDDAFAGEFGFQGRSMTKQQQTIPMKTLVDSAAEQLTLSKEGPGKLYYRLGLRYAPADLQLEAQEQGFVASRTYEALADPGQDEPDPDAVKRLEDGSWVVKAGTNVKVNLSVVVRDRANYVVVDDPLPAGFEGLNPRFVTSGVSGGSGSVDYGRPGPVGISGLRGRRRWWYPWWTFDHSDLRDDRMLLFADHLPAGVYTYSYTARATTIGEFHLPPIKAEAMYEPERFGHSSSSRVRVVQ